MAEKNIQKLIELKKKLKISFSRRNHNTKKRISNGWRRPKGLQNKMRLRKKGYSRCVDSGYGAPNEIKHIDVRSGLYPVIVLTKKDIDVIDAKLQGILIASTVGARKRLELIKYAQEKKITILQNAEKMSAKINSALEQKKKHKEELASRKKKRVDKDKKAVEKKKQKEAEEKTEEKDKKEDLADKAVKEEKKVDAKSDNKDAPKKDEPKKS